MRVIGKVVIAGGVAAMCSGASAVRARADSALKGGADSAMADSTGPAAPGGQQVDISGFATASYPYATRHSGGAGSPVVGRLYDRFHDQIELNAAKLVLGEAGGDR